MEKLSVSPHIREEGSLAGTARSACFAALPALIWGVYAFGWRVLVVCAVSMASALAGEVLTYRFVRRRPLPRDGFAALSGLIFAMLLPPAVSLPLAALGGFSATAVREAFGGLGKNPVNPALTAAGVLYPVFFREMTAYTRPFERLPVFKVLFSRAEIAALAGDPTPLAQEKAGKLPAQGFYQLLSGDLPGALGAGSALLLLAGGLYLLAAKIIPWHTPVAFLTGIVLFSLFSAPEGVEAGAALFAALLSGGTLFFAFFCVTDPVTGPVTRWGRLVYGLIAGLLSAVFRRLTGDVFGMVYAILIANLLARPLDVLFRPRPYGRRYFQHLTAFREKSFAPDGNRAKNALSDGGKNREEDQQS